MPSTTFLPTLNALLNLTAVYFLVRGRMAVKRGDIPGHWRNMTLALCVSALFLSSYLYYHYLVGSVKYEGNAFFRFVYFVVLIPHIILAVAQVPFIVAAVVTAMKQKFSLHVRIVKILWPVWIYVSVTGVIVYLMLYVFPHGAA